MRRPPVVVRRPGRIRRFITRYGWRAYALPLLVIATVLTVVDVAVGGLEPADPSPAVEDSTTASAGMVRNDGPALDGVAPLEPLLVEEGGPVDEPHPEPAPDERAGYVEHGAGTVSVVDGMSAVYGSGRLKRFVVEVEDGLGADGVAFAQQVEATLGDPRSWGHDGEMSFQRVGVAEAQAKQYDFRVSLISPGSMETFCPGGGTEGYTSCRYGERAVINLARWMTAVPEYDGDVATYRQYVVNHEVGHALGRGHESCPGPGRLAPVMQQQTLGLQGCLRNGWPYP